MDEVAVRRLAELQRRLAIGVARAYRTVSTASPGDCLAPPMEFLAEERGSEKRRNDKEYGQEGDDRALAGEMDWTKRLIPDIRPYLRREHGELTFVLTQLLSGHGSFNLYGRKRRSSESCLYCGEQDTAEHTVFQCPRWEEDRMMMRTQLGEVTADNSGGNASR
ncbi:uncharacterized protein LOC142317956 [Lycorma delicatula]|uniref:uncharacterized protein LOC142317956 n=1 Tax=Lycorma delicatula TaxID=130591 RepID=UPI003F51A711